MIRTALAPIVLFVLVSGCASVEPPPEDGDNVRRFVEIVEGPAVTDHASTGGVSWQDLDGDGRPELFVTNGYDVSSADPVPQANVFYRVAADGRLISEELPPLTTTDGFSSGSTWADFDNDGDLDVFVSNQRDQENFLFRNDGEPDGRFRFTRIQPGPIAEDRGWSYSSSWVDVDGDGWVDLFVCNGGLSHAGPNFLYRNLGQGVLEKIADGAIVTDVQATSGCVWGDYDNDGDPDLFVTSGFAQGATPDNRLYRNLGDFEFEIVRDGAPVESNDPSDAAAWGDYDNDGDLDLYVGNQFGMANRLYRNRGDGTFESVAGQAVVTDGGTSFSVNWGDVDNDGDLDLLVVNWGAASILYLNQGGGRFSRSDDEVFAGTIGYGASATLSDFDDDGDLDVYIAHWPNNPGPGEPNRLIENRFARGNWIKLRLRGTQSNRSALGARIETVFIAGNEATRQIREISGATSFRSQDDLVQHFGLGSADRVELITVRWPSGRTESWTDVAANRTVELVEGEGSPAPE